MVLALSVEHASWYGNIGSITIMDLDVVGLMYKKYWLIIVIKCASFGWFLPSLCIISYLFRLIPSEWFSQLALICFKHLLKFTCLLHIEMVEIWRDADCFLRLPNISLLHNVYIWYIIQSLMYCMHVYWTATLGVCVLPRFICRKMDWIGERLLWYSDICLIYIWIFWFYYGYDFQYTLKPLQYLSVFYFNTTHINETDYIYIFIISTKICPLC